MIGGGFPSVRRGFLELLIFYSVGVSLIMSCITSCSDGSDAIAQYFNTDDIYHDTLSGYKLDRENFIINFSNTSRKQNWNVDVEFRTVSSDSFLMRFDQVPAIQNNGRLILKDERFKEIFSDHSSDLLIQFHIMNTSNWYIRNCEVMRFSYYIDESKKITPVLQAIHQKNYVRFDNEKFLLERSPLVRKSVELELQRLSCK